MLTAAATNWFFANYTQFVDGCLCIGCLEQRIGRQLRPRDFARHDRETWADKPCTEPLLNRRGFAKVTIHTPDGVPVSHCHRDAGEPEMRFVSTAFVMIAMVLMLLALTLLTTTSGP